MAGKGMCSLLSLSPGRPRHPDQVLAALALACLLLVGCEKTPVPPAGSARPADTKPATPPPEPEHTLAITSEPSGATVKLNGQARGSTPLEIEGLRPGTYTLRLDIDGHDAWEGDVVVTKESAPPVEATLKRRVSTLSVVSVPPGATVLLDGEDVGVTPTRREGVLPGKHTVTLRLQGYSDHSEIRDLQTDKEMEVRVEMTFDPRRSEIAKRIDEAGTLLEEGRAYSAWRILKEAEALPGWGEVLTKEDERRTWYLHGQVKMVLPRASLQLLFEGQEKALEDGLGPPDEAATVTAAKGSTFVDYEIRAVLGGDSLCERCSAQAAEGQPGQGPTPRTAQQGGFRREQDRSRDRRARGKGQHSGRGGRHPLLHARIGKAHDAGAVGGPGGFTEGPHSGS